MNRNTRHERKCWDCGNVADHYDNCTPEVNCKQCGSQDTRMTKKPPEPQPSRSELHSACLSFRHDYGVMDEDARESLRQSASEWYRCWKSAGVIR